MSIAREKVVVAMSGGVDSSVAACLLVEQGYDVVGLFMRVGDHSVPPEASRRLSDTQAPREPAPTPILDRTPESFSEPHLSVPSDAVRSARPRQGCCSASDAADARFVAGKLGIPFYALNFEDDFARIVDYFADEYARGRTPNPCVMCNDKLKFGKLLEYADAIGARYIATGHYARTAAGADCASRDLAVSGLVCAGGSALAYGLPLSAGHTRHAEPVVPRKLGETSPIRHHAFEPQRAPAASPPPFPSSTRRDTWSSAARNTVLLKAVDCRKDQSYVLFGLKREILDRTLFPIGHLTKDEVRRIAARHGLPNHDKPDSVEICFAPDRDYARIVRRRRPDGFVAGDVTDQDGRVIGRHDGIGHYTIGQRRGLRIAAGKPIYVTRLDVLNNRVVMGDAEALVSSGLFADRANFLVDGLDETFRAQVKIRYLHAAVDATVRRLPGGRLRVVFGEPQRAVTPGQAVVLYDGDLVLGGAWIELADGEENRVVS